MKLNKNLPKLLFVLFIFIGTYAISAQSCKQAFYSAKEQYNGGQFESTQKLLSACINSFNSNSNPDQVYKVYKLYINACIENRDKACANTKRQRLISLFSDKKEADVLKRLDQTKI